MSMKFTPAAWTFTRTCPSPGVGVASSSKAITSGPPGCGARTECMPKASRRRGAASSAELQARLSAAKTGQLGLRADHQVAVDAADLAVDLFQAAERSAIRALGAEPGHRVLHEGSLLLFSLGLPPQLGRVGRVALVSNLRGHFFFS